MAERWEWVEIIEPRTHEHMYANLTTGECVWDPPSGVKIKKTDSNQWWELFDANTSRFYYYNATSQKTVWHRPEKCDIIPLAKLQTLKQNTQVQEESDHQILPPKREISTQTSLKALRREHHSSLKETGSCRPFTSPHPTHKSYQYQTQQDSSSLFSSSGHHHDSFKEQCVPTAQICRQESLSGSYSSNSSAKAGYSSVPLFQTGLVRRESLEMSPQLTDSPKLQRKHSAALRSESSHSSATASRSGSYRYPSDVQMREHSPAFAHDDSYLSQGHGKNYSKEAYQRGSGNDKEYLYSSQSETYTSPARFDSYTPPLGRSCESSFHDSVHSREGLMYDNPECLDSFGSIPHEHLCSSDSMHSSHSSNYRQENLYSPVLNMSRHERERTSQFSPIDMCIPISTRDGLSDKMYNTKVPSGKDECLVFSQDIMCQQQGGHVSSQNKPKLRFPRTNPTYIGVNKRDGHLGYKKINADQQLLDSSVTESQSTNFVGMQTSQIHPEYFDSSFNQDHSGSDASYSSSSANDRETKNGNVCYSKESPALHSKVSPAAYHSLSNNQHLSDSQSSHSSVHNMSDVQSEGSLKNMQDSVASFHDSSDGSVKGFEQLEMEPMKEKSNHAHFSSEVVEDVDSDPDYANIISSIPPPAMNFEKAVNVKSFNLEISQSYLNDEENNMKNVLRERKSNVEISEWRETLQNGDCSVTLELMQQQINGVEHDADEEQLDMMQSSQFLEDQSFEDTESNDLYRQSLCFSLGNVDFQQVSLRHKTNEKTDSPQDSIETEKSLSASQEISPRPLSMVVPTQSDNIMSISTSIGSLSRQGRAGTCPPLSHGKYLSSKQKLPSDSDIENYAQKHLNKHKKGLFGKNVPLTSMLKWSKDPITKPMLRTVDKNVKKEAVEVFKLIQMYMGDRKTKLSQSQLALEITTKGWSIGPDLRDEIFIQICRQTTDNTKEDSLQRGWELMAILLNFFPPTHNFYSYLDGYIFKHMDLKYDLENVPIHHFAEHCKRRLERTMQSGAKRGVRKPGIDEIEQAKKSIYCPSMFGSSLDDIMKMQRDHYPERRLPWIQTLLSEWVLRLNGAQTEGIFRVPGDIDEVNTLKIHCDQWKPPTDCHDPHIPASLLKLWYRELESPLIPDNFYQDCVENYTNAEAAVAVVNRLPEINRLVLAYLIRFLQVFAAPENAQVTKMDVNNLAMVMAPNCLRCESVEPRTIFENTRKEMGFIRTLVQNLDTSFMEGIE